MAFIKRECTKDLAEEETDTAEVTKKKKKAPKSHTGNFTQEANGPWNIDLV